MGIRSRTDAKRGPGNRRAVGIAAGCVAAVGLAALFWKELPALVRYIKIESM